MSQIRVVLVDDHRVVSRGVRSYLESFPDIAIAGVAANGEELLKKFDEWLPDVVIMDLLMPGGMDGIEATKRIRSLSPRTRVVALTASVDEARLIGVLRAGAIGYVRKDSEPEALLAAVRAAAKGQSVIDPAMAGNVLHDFVRGREDGLTERETEVLRQLARGYTNREIADVLSISEETVKTHVGNILSKLHLEHRTQAVIYAFKHNLVSIHDLES
jgi:NarL family two-component system response regulator LiaR